MTLSKEEAAIYIQTVEALRQVNEGLGALRKLKIGCRLQEMDGHYFLDAKAIITKGSLDNPV